MSSVVMGECKKKQKNLTILKLIVNIFKEDTKDYNWAIFTHAMDFFKEQMSLNKPIPKQFFTSLLNNLLTKDWVNL